MGDSLTPKEVSGSSPPASVSGGITSFQRITSFPLIICMWDQPHFATQHNVTKNKAENSDLLFRRCDDDNNK